MRSLAVFTSPRSMPRSRARARTAGEARTCASATRFRSSERAVGRCSAGSRALRLGASALGLASALRSCSDEVTGISSAISGVASTAPSASGRSSLLSSTGSAARSAPSVSITASTEPIGTWSPTSPASSSTLPATGRFHLDRRLVGHHVGDLLVLGDRVADLDVPGDDLRLGNAFADVGQLEFVASHQSAITFSSAFFMRFGPGK